MRGRRDVIPREVYTHVLREDKLMLPREIDTCCNLERLIFIGMDIT